MNCPVFTWKSMHS